MFELDIKDESAKQEAEREKSRAKMPLRNPLYLNLDNYSLFKIRSTIFLIDFPLNYMIRIMDIWSKLIPQNPAAGDFNKEDLQLMANTKGAIREFRHNILDYINHLSEYIRSIKKLHPMKQSYAEIQKS